MAPVSTFIGCLIAGGCLAGLVTIWFTAVYKELSKKLNSYIDIKDQLKLHESLFAQSRDGPDERAAAAMLETSRMLSYEAIKGYNQLIKKPMNRIPALLMGFRWLKENI